MGKEGNGKKRKDASGVFNGTRLGDEAPICKPRHDLLPLEWKNIEEGRAEIKRTRWKLSFGKSFYLPRLIFSAYTLERTDGDSRTCALSWRMFDL